MWCYEGFGWYGFGWLWMILLWGALIGLIVWVVIRLSKRDDSKSKDSHIEIAKERYAKGEISKEELEQIRKDLS
jgi:putative membrane protein